jgi:hypothetical protein
MLTSFQTVVNISQGAPKNQAAVLYTISCTAL